MLIQDLIVVFALGLIAWAWWIDRGIKQVAYLKAKQHCEKINVQLLDDNVRLQHLALIRNSKGLPKLKRTFLFEFTGTGERRHQGTLTMVGAKLESVDAGVFMV